jgi:hypothetical protein
MAALSLSHIARHANASICMNITSAIGANTTYAAYETSIDIERAIVSASSSTWRRTLVWTVESVTRQYWSSITFKRNPKTLAG